MSAQKEVSPPLGSLVLLHGVWAHFCIYQAIPSMWVECQLQGARYPVVQ